MWTPKRIVLLSVCFVAAFAAYLVYAYSSVGGIDGLPPLPEAYWPQQDPHEPSTKPLSKSMLLATIRMAFGDDCPELEQPVRLVLPAKNMVLTAESFYTSPEGRVGLNKLSLATFKDKKDGLYPEITTLRAAVAWLTFDRPVNSFSEIPYRKIVEAELNGDPSRPIEIRNNRRKKERDEDLHLRVKTGPVYYREDTHRIWTNDAVEVFDHRSKPQPHTVTGQGMTLELLTETPPAGPGRKQQKEAITGVKWIELQSAVKMVIHLDGSNGFLGGQDRKPAAAKAAPEPQDGKGRERTELTITTPGKFRYEIYKTHDLAHFEAGSSPNPRVPQQVLLVRKHPGDKNDTLTCQDLLLRLRRRDDKATQKAGEQAGEGLDVETALATSSGPGRDVKLTSDVDGIVVEDANYLLHNALEQKTTMRSPAGPVRVTYKGDTKINAPELEIQDVKPPVPPGWKAGQPLPITSRPYQKVRARGPGTVLMVEKADPNAPGKNTLPDGKRVVRAEWTELLTSDREGAQDVLTLVGHAKFIDEQVQQTLQADTLKVWLDPAEDAKPQPAKDKAARAEVKAQPAKDGPISGSRKVREVLAVGNVLARSKEMYIHDTGKLLVKFTDVPASKHLQAGAPLPPPQDRKDRRPAATPAPTKEVQPRQPQALPKGPEKAPVVTATPASRQGAGPALDPPEQKAAQMPFDLSARQIEAKVERSPIKSVVDELWCQGLVKVRQEAEPAKKAKGEKGTKIDGEKMEMAALPDGAGYQLKVLGGEGANDLAEVSVDRIWICGPEVNVHQGWNKVWVVGEGAMQMESATNFQGEKLKKPTPMNVHWDNSMLFNGLTAEFLGNVQANQQSLVERKEAGPSTAPAEPAERRDGRLAAQHMVVTFDRMVSLRRQPPGAGAAPPAAKGDGSDQPARVRRMFCKDDVRVAELIRDVKDESKVLKYQALFCPVLQVDSLEPEDESQKGPQRNRVVAYGPGTFRTWEQGGGELTPKAPDEAAPKAAPAKQDRQDKDKQGKDRQEYKMTQVKFRRVMLANSQTNTVSFWGDVKVLSLPWPKYDDPLDMDRILNQNPLPEGALYLRCDRIKVLDTPAIVEKGQVKRPGNKEMEGHDNVIVQGREFSAQSNDVTYNQLKQQVILLGSKEAPAKMQRQKYVGDAWQTFIGTKITHNRAKNETKVEGSQSMQGEAAPAPKRK